MRLLKLVIFYEYKILTSKQFCLTKVCVKPIRQWAGALDGWITHKVGRFCILPSQMSVKILSTVVRMLAAIVASLLYVHA